MVNFDHFECECNLNMCHSSRNKKLIDWKSMFNYEMRRVVMLQKTENLIGVWGILSPRSKSILAIKVLIQAVLVSFINCIIYQWLVLLSVKKSLSIVWGGGHGPLWPPWIRHCGQSARNLLTCHHRSNNINSLSKSCHFHIRDIRRIHHLLSLSGKFLQLYTALANSLVTNKLDYCNSTMAFRMLT